MMTLAVTALANLAGAAFAGAVGVGGAMVSIPLMLFVMPPTTAVLMGCSIGLWNVVLQSYAYRRDCSFSDVKWLIAGTLPGAAVGVCFLKYAPAQLLQLSLCGFILSFIALRFFLRGKKFAVVESARFDGVFGMLCGMVSASVGMEGSLLSIYVLMKGWSPDRARGNMSLFLIFAVLCGMLSQLAAGLYSLDMLPLMGTGIAGATAGMFLGVRIGKRINREMFGRILTGFLVLVACILIYRASLL